MSRLRSAPAAKAPKSGVRAAPTGGGRGVYVQTPKSDIYVVLLAISLGAILLGSLFLLLEWNKYGFSLKATAMSTPAASSTLV